MFTASHFVHVLDHVHLPIHLFTSVGIGPDCVSAVLTSVKKYYRPHNNSPVIFADVCVCFSDGHCIGVFVLMCLLIRFTAIWWYSTLIVFHHWSVYFMVVFVYISTEFCSYRLQNLWDVYHFFNKMDHNFFYCSDEAVYCKHFTRQNLHKWSFLASQRGGTFNSCHILTAAEYWCQSWIWVINMFALCVFSCVFLLTSRAADMSCVSSEV